MTEHPSTEAPLCHLVTEQIHNHVQGKISFAEYMETVLYHPKYGYYARQPSLIGATGDFVTAPHLVADFGELLAIQLGQMWERLGCPSPFSVVEMGAGQGLIVQDVCRYLHQHFSDCFKALQYRIIEKSPALVRAQQWVTQGLVLPGEGLHWCTWQEMALDSVVGCFLSNELVDAFPVHLVCWDQGQLWERYVTAINTDNDSIRFQDVVGELSTEALLDYFDLVGIEWSQERYESGYCTEVNLAALDWLTMVAARLHKGYILTIDYGYPAHRYYNPARREGTLQCYYQHAHHSDPYIHLGSQDITSHVDFTALERHGEHCGLSTVGFTQQALFLMALGLGDRIAALSDWVPNETLSMNDILRRRDALHALMNPIGMGNFGVLVQSKGLSLEQQASPLKGLDIPTMA